MVDSGLSLIHPIGAYNIFSKNDFEKTISLHSEKVYKNVIFGNSVIISGYIEEQSVSNYTNFGIDYGKISDLREILEHKYITVSDNLVIALNYYTLMDSLPTNKTYIWHKKLYEPYLFFERDNISSFITNTFSNSINGKHPLMNRYYDLEKSYYYGKLSNDELDKKIEVYKKEYWGLDISKFSRNIDDLKAVIDFCKRNNIRLRAVWMPCSDYVPLPDISLEVMDKCNDILKSRNIEYLDMTNMFPREVFHDLGHLRYEYGAQIFTEEIDKWLIK